MFTKVFKKKILIFDSKKKKKSKDRTKTFLHSACLSLIQHSFLTPPLSPCLSLSVPSISTCPPTRAGRGCLSYPVPSPAPRTVPEETLVAERNGTLVYTHKRRHNSRYFSVTQSDQSPQGSDMAKFQRLVRERNALVQQAIGAKALLILCYAERESSGGTATPRRTE